MRRKLNFVVILIGIPVIFGLLFVWNISNIYERDYNLNVNDPFHSSMIGDYTYIVKEPSFYYNETMNLSLMIFVSANKFNSFGISTLSMNTLTYNHSINIIGLGRNITTTRLTHWAKLTNIYNQLQYLIIRHQKRRNINSRLVLLVVDGYDVIIQSSANHILSQYVQYEQQHQFIRNKIMFNSEPHCFPKAKYCEKYPKIPHDLHGTDRYLNSGMFIGRLDAAHSAFEMILNYGRNTLFNFDYSQKGDQAFMQNVFIREYRTLITLDYYQTMLKSMNRKNVTQIMNDWKYFNTDTIAMNTSSYLWPSVLHFNGGIKPQFAKFINIIKVKEKWFDSKRYKTLRIRTNIGNLTINEIKNVRTTKQKGYN